MKKLSTEKLNELTNHYGIAYESPPNVEGEPIKSQLSRTFNISKEELFSVLSDIFAHERLFSHIGSSSVVDKSRLSAVVGENETLALEHVKEAGPMLALVKYTIDGTDKIQKDIVTNPFGDVNARDKKHGTVEFQLNSIAPDQTTLTAKSTFQSASNVFDRALIDHVWVDFFENVMVHTGELNPAEKLAGPNA
jgi:hypothetical protein